jgi:hypothetical protein
MTIPDLELQPLAYEAVASSYKASRETAAAFDARRAAETAARTALPGMLPDFLLLAAWLIAVSAVFAGFALWPDGYVAREAQIMVAIGHLAGGLVTAMLVGAVGRIVALLEVIAGRKT